jgi:ribose-phosphate pyrophosphokinase
VGTNKKKNADFCILPGRRDDPLAEEVSAYLNTELAPVEFIRFRGKGILGGETLQVVKENLRGKFAYIVWSILNTNDELIQIFQLISTLKRNGKAQTAVLVMPDYPYARQDKSHARRECISARLVGDLLEAAGLDHVITMTLHSEQIEGFFRSVDHLKEVPLMANYFSKRFEVLCNEISVDAHMDNFVVMAPDEGGVRHAEEFGRNVPGWTGQMAFAMQQRDRRALHKKDMLGVVGDVEGKIVAIPDDILASGSTLFNSARAAKHAGAIHVIGFCAHALGFDSVSPEGELLRDFSSALADSALDELVVTDSRPDFTEDVMADEQMRRKVSVISVVPYLGEAIRRDISGDTIREMIRSTNIGDLYYEKHRAGT